MKKHIDVRESYNSQYVSTDVFLFKCFQNKQNASFKTQATIIYFSQNLGKNIIFINSFDRFVVVFHIFAFSNTARHVESVKNTTMNVLRTFAYISNRFRRIIVRKFAATRPRKKNRNLFDSDCGTSDLRVARSPLFGGRERTDTRADLRATTRSTCHNRKTCAIKTDDFRTTMRRVILSSATSPHVKTVSTCCGKI